MVRGARRVGRSVRRRVGRRVVWGVIWGIAWRAARGTAWCTGNRRGDVKVRYTFGIKGTIGVIYT